MYIIVLRSVANRFFWGVGVGVVLGVFGVFFKCHYPIIHPFIYAYNIKYLCLINNAIFLIDIKTDGHSRLLLPASWSPWK